MKAEFSSSSSDGVWSSSPASSANPEVKAACEVVTWPRPEEVWVGHLMRAKAGESRARCEVCGMVMDDVSPANLKVFERDCHFGIFVRGEDVCARQPRTRFLVQCRPTKTPVPMIAAVVVLPVLRTGSN